MVGGGQWDVHNPTDQFRTFTNVIPLSSAAQRLKVRIRAHGATGSLIADDLRVLIVK
jgi:hypothetical protein